MECGFFTKAINFTLLILVCQPLQGVEVPHEPLEALSDGQFRVREDAQSKLLAWARIDPGPSMDELLKEFQSSEDPEVRERCLEILRVLVAEQFMGEGQGFLGVIRIGMSVDLPGESTPCHGVLVTGVRLGTPANRAGIRLNDVIVSVNGTRWSEATASDEFGDQIAALKPGSSVKIGIFREGKLIELEVVLTRRPANADHGLFNDPGFDSDAEERAAIEAHFREWLREKLAHG